MPADRNNQKKIQCWIPIERWDKIESLGYSSITVAVTDAFTKVIENPKASTPESQEIPTLKARLEEIERHNETLKHELEKAERDKEDLKELLKSNDENQLLRITDLKEEISVLRNELTNKNDTIKNLTTITESQIKGYELIEAPGAKKPWWRFW
jgi:chromosome segregation ATPase